MSKLTTKLFQTISVLLMIILITGSIPAQEKDESKSSKQSRKKTTEELNQETKKKSNVVKQTSKKDSKKVRQTRREKEDSGEKTTIEDDKKDATPNKGKTLKSERSWGGYQYYLYQPQWEGTGECLPNTNESSNYGPGLSVEQCAKKCYADKNCNYFDFDPYDGDCWKQPVCWSQDSDHYSAWRLDGSADYYSRVFPDQRGECLPNHDETYAGSFSHIECAQKCMENSNCNYFDWNPVGNYCYLQSSCTSRDTDGNLAFKIDRTYNYKGWEKAFYVRCSFGEPGCVSDGMTTKTETFTLNQNTTYNVKIEVLKSDMESDGEKLTQIKVNGIPWGSCNPPTGTSDFDCTYHQCFEILPVTTGWDGKLTVEVNSDGMTNDCLCNDTNFDDCSTEHRTHRTRTIPMGLQVKVTVMLPNDIGGKLITGMYNNQCLDYNKNASGINKPFFMSTCNSSAKSQRWELIGDLYNHPGGQIKHKETGLCIESDKNKVAVLKECSSTPSQTFRLVGSSHYSLQEQVYGGYSNFSDGLNFNSYSHQGAYLFRVKDPS